MTKGEFINLVYDISSTAESINSGVQEELDDETVKDLVDKLVNLVSLCQACLMNNTRDK